MLNFWTLNGPTVLPPTAPDFETAVVTALKGSPSVVATVGNNVFPVAIPEETILPALSYRITSKPREMTLDGPSGIAAARLQINARSHAYADTKAVKDAIRNLFKPVPLVLSNIAVIDNKLTDESDEYEEPLEASDRGTFDLTLEFLMRFREP